MSLFSPKDLHQLEVLILAYENTPFDSNDARESGKLQSVLRAEGAPLGTIDALLAGMSIARDGAIVTGDRRLASVGHGIKAKTYRTG